LTRIERNALVPFSCKQMFALVNDIESYPEYMPGCVGAKILVRHDESLDARLDIQRMGVRQSFSTRNILTPPSSMRMSLLGGPFKSLESEWCFDALSDTACKVRFWIEIEFSNAILALTLPAFFEKNASDQVSALCDRAKRIYPEG
jgi:ribosome-associated toxin RatA of RatAB toxin-antitoxin module